MPSAALMKPLFARVGWPLRGGLELDVAAEVMQLADEAHDGFGAVVAVEVDGGRLRTRATGCGPGVHTAAGKEDKVACLVTLTDVVRNTDPCPEPPPSFVEPRRILRLVAQMKGQPGEHDQNGKAQSCPEQARHLVGESRARTDGEPALHVLGNTAPVTA